MTIKIIPFGKKEPTLDLIKEYNTRDRNNFFNKDKLFQLDFPKKHRGIYSTITTNLRSKKSFGLFEQAISSKDLKQQVNLLLSEIEEKQRKGVIDVDDLYCIINKRLGWKLR